MSTAIYLDRSDAAKALALSESTLEKLVREDDSFPKPRRLSANRVGWLRRELDAWAESRPVSDLPPPRNTGGRKKLGRSEA